MKTRGARWTVVVVAMAAGGALVVARGCEETADVPTQSAVAAASPHAPSPAARRSVTRPSAPAGDAATEARGEAAAAPNLADSVALRVRVEDRRTGAPIVGAQIDVDVVGDDATDVATTGDDGERVMPERADAILRVTASAKGYDEASTSVRTGAPGTSLAPVVLRLARLGRLTGVVRGPDGVAVPKAFVVVAPESMPLDQVADQQPWRDVVEKRAFRVFADRRGTYTADGLTLGRRYHAFARAGDSPWAPSAVVEDVVVTADARKREQDLVLSKFGRLVVRVVTADGSPVDADHVTVWVGGRAWPVESDRSGLLVAERLPPGPAIVSCLSAGNPASEVVIPTGGTAEVTLDRRTMATLRGVVVDDAGQPVPEAEVDVDGRRSTALGFSGMHPIRTDANGAFEGVALKPGPCTVTAAALRHRPASAVRIYAPAENVRVVLRRAAVLTFHPTPNARSWPGKIAYVRFDVGLGNDDFTMGSSDVTHGAVRVDCEPVGDTRVRLYLNGLAPVVRRATLTAGSVTELGEVHFAEPRIVGIHVADATARAVAGALVEPDDSGWRPAGDRAPSTDADGNASYPWAPPSGPLPLRVRAPGFLELRTIVDVAGDAPITLTLTRDGLLWGEARDADGVPAPDAEVHVVDARGADVARVTADRHGQFDVRVAPGRYTVRAGDGPGVSVELAEGRDEHVRLVASGR